MPTPALRASAQPDGGRAARLLSGLALAAFAGALLVAEAQRPLREPTQPRRSRLLRNLAMGGLAGAVLSLAEGPAVERLTSAVERRGWGLLKRWRLAPMVELTLGVALMDYTLFLWHVMTHRVPVLWRMHLPHHVDLDLDVSTALRFHFAELAASVPYRAAQVLLLGIGPKTFRVWRTFTIASVLFHHSNLRLPRRLEAALELVLMTPRLHGIHHSAAREETNSNWSSGLSVWDRLHGTYRAEPPQRRIRIGVPAYQDPSELTLSGVLALPFRAQRPAWRARPPLAAGSSGPRFPTPAARRPPRPRGWR
jgi:sterol desaturase/sphingolipid hydroxylase (fatty acid hydroxylase superfamily)